MKKLWLIWFCILVSTVSGYAIASYYGLNGLNYIPIARTGTPGRFEIGISSLPAPASSLNIFPYSTRLYWTINKTIEIALTNTYQYYIAREQRFPGYTVPLPDGAPFVADTANVTIPYIPSVKLAFMDEAVANGSLAVGIEYPYGVFLLFDYDLALPAGFSLYTVVGLSTTIATIYGLGGIRIGFPIPVALTIEGAYGGETKVLTSPQETFVSAGLYYEISQTVTLDFIFRLDADGIRRLSFGYNVKF